MKTDEKYIENIRLQYKRRKRAGTLLIFVTLALCVLTYVTIKKTNESSFLILDTLQLQQEGNIVTSNDIKNVKFSNELAHSMGMKTGVLLSMGVIFITIFFCYVYILFFGMRKERLLIKYYDKSKN